MGSKYVSSSVIKRLPRYYRFLGYLMEDGMVRISSRELAERMGLSASQIRQDLNNFGGFGQQGYGYNIESLYKEIGKILGVDSGFKTILVGAGNLGHTIALQIEYEKRGFDLIAIFDKKESLSGQMINGIPIRSSNDIEDFCRDNGVKVAILCIPYEAAKELVPTLVNSGVTKRLLDSDFSDYPFDMAEGKDVIVIGGGDTGNDCVGTCIRLGAKSVTQLEMMPEPPAERTASNPWPEWPRILKTDYGQEEALWKFGRDPRVYQTTVKEFIKDESGALKEAVLISLLPQKDEKTGRISMVPEAGSERTVPAQLVLIAAGFLGSEPYVTEGFGIETDGRTNVRTSPGRHLSSKKGIYAAGDMHRGQSLVVWAIAEGRSAAKEVDEALMGYTNL